MDATRDDLTNIVLFKPMKRGDLAMTAPTPENRPGTALIPLLGRVNTADKPAPDATYRGVRDADRREHTTQELLVTPENPSGWRLDDVLYRLHCELQAMHRRSCYTSGTMAAEVSGLQRQMLDHIREAEILQMQIDDTLASGTEPGRKGS